MASFNMVGLDTFEEIEKMLRHNAENAERIAEDMIKAGARVLIAAQKSELARMAKSDRSIGTLQNSIGMGRMKRGTKASSTAIHTDVFPQGDHPHGQPGFGKRGNVSSAQVGFVLEYGHSNMPGRPWMSVAKDKAADAVIDAMADVWEEKTNV